MLSKSKIKFINSLKLGKYRKQHKMFFAEGSINVLDFIRNTGLLVVFRQFIKKQKMNENKLI